METGPTASQVYDSRQEKLVLEMRRIVTGGISFYQPQDPDAGEKIWKFYNSMRGRPRSIFLSVSTVSERVAYEMITGGLRQALAGLRDFNCCDNDEYRGLKFLLKLMETPDSIDDEKMGFTIEDHRHVIDVSKKNPEKAEIGCNSLPEYARSNLTLVEPDGPPEEAAITPNMIPDYVPTNFTETDIEGNLDLQLPNIIEVPEELPEKEDWIKKINP